MSRDGRMTVPEMNEFIVNVGRSALLAELYRMRNDTEWSRQADRWGTVTSRYAAGVCSSLITLGYDEAWVNGEFRSTLETWYFTGTSHGWISVKDRLPEKWGEHCLCFLRWSDDTTAICENVYMRNGFWEHNTDNVTYWMPLPLVSCD